MRLRALITRWRRRRRYHRCLQADSGLIVLRYHSVARAEDAAAYVDPGLSVSPERFREQLRILARRFRFVRADEIPGILDAQRSGERCVAITFDDGFKDNVESALPILREVGAVATFFVTSGPASKQGTFWISELFRLCDALPEGPIELSGILEEQEVSGRDSRFSLRRRLTSAFATLPLARREAALDALAERAGLSRGSGLEGSFMDAGDLRRLRDAGMLVGAHTVSHPHLNLLDDAWHDEEVLGSKRMLEEMLGETVETFAYPNPGGERGVSAGARASAERAGFRCAVTSVTAPLTVGSDPLRVSRIGVYEGPQDKLLFSVLGALPERVAHSA